MNSLNDLEEIKKLDGNNMLGSLESFSEQLKSAWSGSKAVRVPQDLRNAQNIVVAGMGGSALGAHFVRSAFDISLPLQIVNDYKLPVFVNQNTLVIVSSYSGTTEETITALADALKKGAKIIGIASGGSLVEALKKENRPFFQIDPRYNPCGQPRMGLCYSVGALLGFLSQLGFIDFSDQDMEEVFTAVGETGRLFGVDCQDEQNLAKKTAQNLLGKIPIVVAAEFLSGNAHIFANQINESAKTFAAYFLLPEINHHLLEGTRFPGGLGERIKFVFLESALYSEKIKRRVKITKDVLSKSAIESVSYNAISGNKSTAAFKALSFSSWTSFYLAIANEINPTPIPNVDYFKEQLAKFA